MKSGYSIDERVVIRISLVLTGASGLFHDMNIKDSVPSQIAFTAGFVAVSLNQNAEARRRSELIAALRARRQQVSQELLTYPHNSFQGDPSVGGDRKCVPSD